MNVKFAKCVFVQLNSWPLKLFTIFIFHAVVSLQLVTQVSCCQEVEQWWFSSQLLLSYVEVSLGKSLNHALPPVSQDSAISVCVNEKQCKWALSSSKEEKWSVSADCLHLDSFKPNRLHVSEDDPRSAGSSSPDSDCEAVGVRI